ncbi:hypothetical protein HYALB_00009458 [Hymenoscyphus albidus]|uniref:non-specific serine/threonine protein kinase n=1 Tax=Hymenoscyphus albidus TaxID=595503 RepID=A0A9N9LSD8_9HELO|nr:hypothetical protein HYALB_00009458 [Hymenoscyphus albidus]
MDSSTTSKIANSAPSSPGLFSPSTLPQRIPLPPSDGTPHSSPYLHPLQMHKVRETHKAMVEQDFLTGRKLINQYEVIEEIGRGVHGKVKLARSLETSDYVAIKIIQRFSKKRRLGKVTVSPETKTKREIAILKKIRHPHVVGLLEVIDDADAKKIYMILEHVELGEITWRKKGSPRVCAYERRRIEGERRGEEATEDDEIFFGMIERRRLRKEAKREKTAQNHAGRTDFWSLEHGNDDEDGESLALSRQNTRNSSQSLSHYRPTTVSAPVSHPSSRAPSNAPSRISSRAHTPLPIEYDIPAIDSDNEEEPVGPLPSLPSHQSLPSQHSASVAGLEGSYYGSCPEEPAYRGRSPSMADSVISHMSSVDDGPHDAFEEDYSYVPCFTIEQARSAFRDTVLGLEYLHYEGIVHRDIKPANLLWTKDHRVKISDFGVSYFGRPIREGETEENVSEADAADFDDDLELAKTVGTPAFFAPELCYTDLDIEQPKITEQIDVWSLGVTLYCLIFARIPFLADDEYKLFRSIAKDDVYIPKRRLKAVNPSLSTSTSTTSLGKRVAQPSLGPYREEGELAYENIDDELLDLLRRMLVKDPAERVKLREVKRHPWVIKGIDNIIGWLDDTDPSRKTAGRRIEVDDRELERAVVPLNFLERARSALKKTVNKVIGATRSETRGGEGSRKRAISSATSSGTDNLHTPTTPGSRDGRRASLRGDESYFLSNHDIHDHREQYAHAGHPLSQSLTASPDYLGNVDPLSRDSQHSSSVGATPKQGPSGPSSDFDTRPGPPDRENSTSASMQTVTQRGHAYSKSVNNAGMSSMHCDGANTPGPFTDPLGSLFGHLWHNRGREQLAEIEEGTASRARSVDRSLFESDNKHSEPSLALSDAVAPGRFEHGNIKTYPFGFSKSEQASPAHPNYDKPLPSLPLPLFFEPRSVHDHQATQTTQSASTPSFPRTMDAASNLDQRPATAHKVPADGSMCTPPPRTYGASTPESFQRAVEIQHRKQRLEQEALESQKQVAAAAAIKRLELKPFCPPSPCPPSPDDEMMGRMQEDADKRAQSYSSVNSTSVASPSDVTSPVSSVNLGSQEKVFPSVPSLPALISGGSSVSADTEGEFLQHPGVTYYENPGFTADSTPDTLTPPSSISKHSTRDSEVVTTTYAADDTICLSPDLEDDGCAGDGDGSYADDDSDSDEGLTMTTRKKSKTPAMGTLARRGTDNSAGSTETAKKVVMES